MFQPPQTDSVSADWTPTTAQIQESNIAWLMKEAKVDNYRALHAWSVQHFEEYWATVIARLGIKFQKPFHQIVDLSGGLESPQWIPGAQLNIVESCFSAHGDSPAIVYQSEGGSLKSVSVSELKQLTGKVAAGLTRCGFQPGDAIAILMPMTVECVAIYLGILQAGCVAVSIADSFRPKEIMTRLRIANAVGIFTQAVSIRGGKVHSLYDSLKETDAPKAIVLLANESTELREGDCSWDSFLPSEPATEFASRSPSDRLNILFSSGTTGDPKAIPWTQITPLKCAADAHFHQEVSPGDVVVWPTNIGWMMGPWLVFASLLNRATIGLFDGAPTGAAFCRFVQDAQTTMLGTVPSIVKAWRTSNATEALDWSSIRTFSSTGECSNAEDMRWLMDQAGGRPLIEYCGGTEIGGGYITATMALPIAAGTFNTPALGIDFVLLDDADKPARIGEVYLSSSSIGLSNTLLNKDHHEVYFAGTPSVSEGGALRRHGDQLEFLPGGFWRAQGRVDDTMNLGGIKVSSAEIESVLQDITGVKEVAAIAVSPSGGPSLLVVYVVITTGSDLAGDELRTVMQNAIKRNLNPLFKIHEVVTVEALPRTTSNKIMRRTLRDQYEHQA